MNIIEMNNIQFSVNANSVLAKFKNSDVSYKVILYFKTCNMRYIRFIPYKIIVTERSSHKSEKILTYTICINRVRNTFFSKYLYLLKSIKNRYLSVEDNIDIKEIDMYGFLKQEFTPLMPIITALYELYFKSKNIVLVEDINDERLKAIAKDGYEQDIDTSKYIPNYTDSKETQIHLLKLYKQYYPNYYTRKAVQANSM